MQFFPLSVKNLPINLGIDFVYLDKIFIQYNE